MARKMFSLSELRNLDFGKMVAAFQILKHGEPPEIIPGRNL